MTYRDSVGAVPPCPPWAVARLLPDGKWVIIGRYHNRSDAEGHWQLLCQRVPDLEFRVVFDLPQRPT